MGQGVLKGFMLAVMAAVLWGVSGAFSQVLFQQKEIDVMWLLSVRMLISGACLLALAFFREKANLFSIWKNKRDALQLGIFSITGMLSVQYTYFAAIKHANAATATVLQYAGPILIAIYLAIKNRQLPARVEALAIVLAVTGVFFLVTHGNIGQLSISGAGLFFGLASAVALAIYTLQPIALLSQYPASLVIGWAMLAGGLVCGLVAPPWQVMGIWDVQTYLYTAFIVVFGTLVPFYAYLTAVKIIGGQKTSLLASAEPLAATIIAVLWLNTQFSTMDWLGSICIIATVFLLSSKKEAAS